VVGNAAALLLKKILCSEVFSPLGSEAGDSGIEFIWHKSITLVKIVPCIMDDSPAKYVPDGKNYRRARLRKKFYQVMSAKRKN